jgi:hypothetical protein
MVGSLPCLGSWNPDKCGLPMTWSNEHCWWVEVPLDMNVKPQSTIFEFKFVVLENGRTKKWESGNNHVFDGPKVNQILQSGEV